MSLVDTDLLSIQEARVLLERAEGVRGVLEGLSITRVDDFLSMLAERLLPKAEHYAHMAFQESDYGNAQDEAELVRWVLTDLLAEVCAQVPVQELCACPQTHVVEVALSKGPVLSLLPDWISVPTLLSQAICAIRSKSPIVFSARSRIHGTCSEVMKDLVEIAAECHYPVDALGFLGLYSAEGEEWLSRQDGIRVLIDSREYERVKVRWAHGKDLYYASVGNNPVFVEATADLARSAEQIVDGTSFCCGMLPGAEQSIVAEASIDAALKAELVRCGCRFLTAEESSRLITTLFAPDGRAYRELIAKSAPDLARRADIPVAEGTRVLVMECPYVSEVSMFARAKYGPVLSYYVEEDWRDACEKCIEFILGCGHGNALSIFSSDAEVIRQFILKKPVGRILLNTSSGFGSIGWRSELPKTLTVTGWDIATTSGLGVTYRDFVRYRQVGTGTLPADRALLEAAEHAHSYDSFVPAMPHVDAMRESSQDWFSSLLESVK